MKLPTIWTDEKHSQEESEPGRKSGVEKIRREKTRDGENQQREHAGARKGGKVAKHCIFPCAPEGRKEGSLKRRGAEVAGQMKNEKLYAVVARSTF